VTGWGALRVVLVKLILLDSGRVEGEDVGS